MHTENRSSNTEMVSVPFEREERYIVIKVSDLASVPVAVGEPFAEQLTAIQRRLPKRECLVIESDWPEYAPTWAAIERRVTGAPAPQPHPEPIAWMVGTAFWWTKEEAERDAKTTGLAVVPVGPMVDTAEVERLESRIETQRESIRSHVQEVDRLRVLEIKYGLKIEERNDLLRKCLEWITSARDGVLYPIARDFEGVVGRNAEGLGQATPALIDAIGDALSVSAEPSAPNDCAICRDLGNQCMECEEGEFREWADRHFAAADYRKTDAGVFIQDWMRHAYGAWCARGALTSKQ